MTLCKFCLVFVSLALLNNDECDTIACHPIPGYLLVKEYQLPFKDGKPKFEFSYVLIKGNEYVFSINTGSTSDIPSFELFNSGRREVVPKLPVSSREKLISFKCNASGTYYFRLSESTACCGLWLGFKRT